MYLVLSRKINEEIQIGSTIAVKVVRIDGDKVRLAISAPGDVPVHRKEVYEAKYREFRDLAAGVCDDSAVRNMLDEDGAI